MNVQKKQCCYKYKHKQMLLLLLLFIWYCCAISWERSFHLQMMLYSMLDKLNFNLQIHLLLAYIHTNIGPTCEFMWSLHLWFIENYFQVCSSATLRYNAKNNNISCLFCVHWVYKNTFRAFFLRPAGHYVFPIDCKVFTIALIFPFIINVLYISVPCANSKDTIQIGTNTTLNEHIEMALRVTYFFLSFFNLQKATTTTTNRRKKERKRKNK